MSKDGREVREGAPHTHNWRRNILEGGDRQPVQSPKPCICFWRSQQAARAWGGEHGGKSGAEQGLGAGTAGLPGGALT